ncbi:MAG: PKD domain-containing protein, partial [Thermoplasmata archaeon]
DSLRQTSPSLAVQAETLAYDPDSGYVYIAGRLSENLVVLNASTLTTVHPPVLLPGEPTSLVDDSATGVVYVAYTGGVVAVDALTGSITTRNAALPGNNTQLVVDSVADLLWDVNSNLGLVALDLSTLAVDLTPGLIHGMPNLQGVAFDPATNELFAVDLFNSTIAVVNATTGREMTPAISGVAGAISVTYDPADQSIYALGRSVWIIDPATRTVVGGPIAITPHVAAWSIVYDPSREYLYVASNTTLNGSCPGNVTVIDGSSVAASQEGAYATIAVGQLPVDIQPVQLAGGSAPGSSEIWVTNLVSGTVSVIASPPTITYFAASPNPVDLGANTTILVGLDGGAGASQMSFSGLPSGCVSSDATSIRCTPDSGGSYTIQATAVDTLGQTTSATAVLSVSPSLILHTTFSTSPDAQVDLGQSMSATATTSGGNAPYNYTWNFGDSMAAWGQSVTHTYAATGVYLVTLLVADAGGGDSSLTSTVTVVGLPTLTISVSPSNITDVGKIIDLSGTVSGGTTPGSASWTFGDGAVATGSSVSHAYTSSGIYFATFHYIDATGVNVSKFMMVQVNPALGASLAVSPNPSTSTVRPGTALVFSTSLSGGTEPYTVVWSFDDGSYGYGLSVSHTYATAGKYNVTLFVEDAVGAEWNASYSVTVQAPSTGGLGAGFGTGLILGLLIGGAAAAIVLFGATRSRHSPPRPPTAFVPPASGTERDETQPWRES